MSELSESSVHPRLRGLLSSDLPYLMGWLADPEVWRFLAVQPYMSEWELRDWLTASGVRTVIADNDGCAVGFARLAVGEGRWTGICWLTIAITPQEQSRGIGMKLLREAHQVARHLGMRKVIAQLYSANERARRLYDRLGYRLEAEVRNGSLFDGLPGEGVHLAFDLVN